MTERRFLRSRWLMLSAAPLLIAATAPGEGLDTPTLLFMTTAIVGVILLRGVFLRRHLRKKRRGFLRDQEWSDITDSVDTGGDSGSGSDD